MTVGHMLILLFLAIIGCIALSMMCFRILTWSLEGIKKSRDNEKAFRAKQKERNKMLADGEIHEWIKMPIGAKEVTVCKKTGWCPDVKGFINKPYIDEHLNRIKMREDYKKFRNKRVAELSEKWNISISQIEVLIEEVFSIKKDFHLGKVDNLLAELRGKSEEVGNDEEVH